MAELKTLNTSELKTLVESLSWYHTLDLGNGIITQGHYDHRPFLHHYGIPNDLNGKTALDIGAASGFFSFEMERRGARVTATDLPAWFDHDFGPNYQPDQTVETGEQYLHEPFQVAKRALDSQVEMKYINIYDISAAQLGTFDLVFCGSVLLHLTDPTKALCNIAQVTKEKAIIATVIAQENSDHAHADFVGHHRGDVWWIPTRTCLELMAVAAGFAGVEWIGEFTLNYRGQSHGPYHGVMHCYKTTKNWTPQIKSRDEIIRAAETPLAEKRDNQVEELKALIDQYQNRRSIRFANWLDNQRSKIISFMSSKR